jgi:hypothetical protein
LGTLSIFLAAPSELWWVGVLLCLSGSVSLNFGNNMQSLGLQGYDTKPKNGTRHLADADAAYRTADVDEPPGEGASVGGGCDSNPARRASMEPLAASSPGAEESGRGVDSPPGGGSGSDSPQKPGSAATPQPMYSPRLFYLGTAMFLCGSILTFVAFGFAAQSLLASLEGVQFVSNVVFAKVMRNTTITYNVIAGSVMIVLGICTVVVLGSHTSETLTSLEIEHLYENPEYLTFLWFLGSAAVFLRYTEKAYSKRLKQGKPWPRSNTIIPVCYAAFSAIFGTQMVTQAKCLMMAIKLTFNGQNQFTYGFTYIMIAIFLACAWVWLYRMGRALKRFDPMFIIPVLQVCFILFAIITGGIFFQEFYTFGAAQAVGFVMGVLLVCLGLYLLAPPSGDLEVGGGEAPRNATAADLVEGAKEAGDGHRLGAFDEVEDGAFDDVERKGVVVGGGGGEVGGRAASDDSAGGSADFPNLGRSRGDSVNWHRDPASLRPFHIGSNNYVTRRVSEGGKSVIETVGTFASVVKDDVVGTLHETAAAPVNMAGMVAAGARGAFAGAAHVAEMSSPNALLGEVEQQLTGIDWRATTAQLNLIASAQDEGVDYGVQHLEQLYPEASECNPMHQAMATPQKQKEYLPARLPEMQGGRDDGGGGGS